MADIKLDFGFEGLDEIKKGLREIEKSVKRYNALLERSGNITDDDVLSTKRLAVEKKKLENQLKKQEIASKRIADQQERINKRQRESKGIIGGLEAEVRRLRSAMKSATNPADVAKFNKKLKETQAEMRKAKGATAGWGKALGSFQFKFNALGNIAANVFSRITSGMTEFVKESAKMAAEAEGIGRAFEKLNKPGLLEELRKATKGTVSDIELMKSAVKANNFKIPLEQLGSFFKFAEERAIDTGESVDYLVESITNGIARKSLPILDNLGLSATEVRDEFSKTGDMAKAVANIIERSMGESADRALTSAERQAQLTASVDNLKTSIGGYANEILAKVLPAVEKWIEGTALALKTQQELKREAWDAKTREAIVRDAAEVDGLAKAYIDAGIAVDEKTAKEMAAKAVLSQYEIRLAKLAEEEQKRRDIILKSISDETERKEKLEELLQYEDDRRRLISLQIGELERLLNAETAVNLATGDTIDFASQEIQLNTQLIKTLNDLAKAYAKKQASFSSAQASADSFLFGGDDEEINEPEVDAAVDAYRKGEEEKIKAAEESAEKRKQIEREAYQQIGNFASSYSALIESQKQKELSAVGDNAKAREKIEEKYAEKQRKIAIFEAIIAGGAASSKAWQQYGWPWALVPQAIIAASVGTQIATISNAKYAEGGEIFGEPHSRGGVNIEAEGGEYVINKRATSKYKDLISAINDDDQMRIMDAMSRDKKIEIKGGADPWTRKIYEEIRRQERYGEDNEFYIQHKGNTTLKIRKN